MLDAATLERRLAAERLRDELDALEAAFGDLNTRFNALDAMTVEEQLALRLAFFENRTRRGEASRELLRLACA